MCADIEQLGERKQKILKAVVHEHIETAEPVGSEALMQHYDFGVRSATIRNEMAEMSDMGYLLQPHTSAGRIPSDIGYRFYVDRLMGRVCLMRREAERAKMELAIAATELDRVISHTCRILTGLTCYTSIATKPVAEETVIRHINLTKVGARKIVLVVVLSDGRVEHGIVGCEENVTDSEVVSASNLLAARFIEKAIQDVGTADDMPNDSVYNAAVGVLRQVVEDLAQTDASIYVEGMNCVLRQPEFKDLSKLEVILTALEQRTWLCQLLSRAFLGPDVTVIIGAENPYCEMHDTSFIAARYKIGDRTVGTIGIIGPTRMDYRRSVAAVDTMASNLSELLTKLSLS